MTATPGPGTPAAAAATAGPQPCRCSPPAPVEKDGSDANVSMAVTVEEAPWMGWVVAKALMRFAFMVANNLVAIPSYICYVIILQPLRVLNSERFWYIEGLMYKWLLGMVASWGWYAGYTGSQVVTTTRGIPESVSPPNITAQGPETLRLSWSVPEKKMSLRSTSSGWMGEGSSPLTLVTAGSIQSQEAVELTVGCMSEHMKQPQWI